MVNFINFSKGRSLKPSLLLIERTGASLASLPAAPLVFVAEGDESQTVTAGVPSQGNTAGR